MKSLMEHPHLSSKFSSPQDTKRAKTKIVVIGGGTGTFVALSGLKKYPVELTAIITMMDSGGSSGRLRDEFGILPPGDVRQCLVALSGSSKLLREMFNYRFEEGELKGHAFGNIFLTALIKTTGSMKQAIEEAGKILRIHGRVIPVTYTKSDLCVELIDGTVIRGQTHIDETEQRKERAGIKKAYLSPTAYANPDAKTAIRRADVILIGPGDLYTSIIPNLLVDGISEELKKAKGKKIYVLNLMTKYGQTTSHKASDHVADLEKYIGKEVLDIVLVNNHLPIKEALLWYKDFDEHPVSDDLKDEPGFGVIRKNLVRDRVIEKKSSDALRRSIIRHDSDKLATEIIRIVEDLH